MSSMLKQIQFYQYHLNLQETALKLALLVSILVLFFASPISGYFSDHDVNYWFDYFVITERFSMLLLLLSVSKHLKEKCWLGYELLLAFLMQDLVDRTLLNVKVFNVNDIICLGVITIQLIYKIYARFKKQIHIFFNLLGDWRNNWTILSKARKRKD